MKKSNTKEIKALIVLLAVLSCILFYRYRIMPRIEKIKSIKTQIQSTDTLVRGLYTNVSSYPSDVENLKELRKELTEELNNYYIDVDQEKYIGTIIEWAKASSLTISQISSQESQQLDVAVDGYSTENPLEGVSSEFYNPAMEMTLSIQVYGKYINFLEFINNICTNDKVLISTNSSITAKVDSINPKNGEQVGFYNLDLKFVNIVPTSTFAADNEIPTMNNDFVMPQKFIDKSYQNLLPGLSTIDKLLIK